MSAAKTTFCTKGGCRSGKGLLVVGGPDEFHAAYAAGYKSHKNRELTKLMGLVGSLRLNKAGTCVVLDLNAKSGGVIRVATMADLRTFGYTDDQMRAALKAGTAWNCWDTNGGSHQPLIVTADLPVGK